MDAARTPFETFRPRRWLRNGHLQTIVGNFLPRVDRLPPATAELVPVPLPEEMLHLPQAVALDRLLPSKVLCHCHWQQDLKQATTVVLVHGLEGSSHSQYVVGNANRLYAAGCNVVRMNMRNCGSTDALSPTLYHSGMSGDAVAVLHWLVARGCTRVVLAGYSMGGNLVLKAAGELGAGAPPELIGVVAVSPPVDLGESADALHHWTNRIYERRFLRNLLLRYRLKAKLYPAVFDPRRIERVQSIRDFDEFAMTPYCGFDGADDYYARSGSARVLQSVAVPTLILHALDDPFIRLTVNTRTKLQTNPNIQLLEPAHGGHCAFLEDPAEGYDGYWAERALLRFVQELAAAATTTEVAAC
ncbi:MAG: YheT family hydrolase [Janthinobacterium lividum]